MFQSIVRAVSQAAAFSAWKGPLARFQLHTPAPEGTTVTIAHGSDTTKSQSPPNDWGGVKRYAAFPTGQPEERKEVPSRSMFCNLQPRC